MDNTKAMTLVALLADFIRQDDFVSACEMLNALERDCLEQGRTEGLEQAVKVMEAIRAAFRKGTPLRGELDDGGKSDSNASVTEGAVEKSCQDNSVDGGVSGEET